MRPIERVVVFGGLLAAIVLGLAGRYGDSRAVASPGYAAGIKIGTVDIYLVAERMMGAADLKKVREDVAANWQAKADAISKELREMDDNLSVLPQNDPKVQELMKKAQLKQQDYQKVVQDRQQELERVNSSQLIEAYGKIRAAVETIGAKMEYTHIIANREYGRPITTFTLSQTLQELLARPIVNDVKADDLTKAVMAELKLEE
jgi:Skp family chaperone for outer membrane proteins